MSLTTFLANLLGPVVTADAIRSEIYFLGSRHQGEVLSGALAELDHEGLSPDRVRLLHAVVARLKSQ